MIALKIAVLNLFRHKRRSGTLLLLLGVSQAILFLVNSYQGGTSYQLADSFSKMSGHLQIGTKNSTWPNTPGGEKEVLTEETEKVLSDWLEKQPEVLDWDPRSTAEVIVGTESVTSTAVIEGVDPQITNRGFMNVLKVVDGYLLERGDQYEALLGRDLAGALGVSVEDSVTILTTTLSGAYAATTVNVKGLITVSNPEADRRMIILPEKLVRTELLDSERPEKWLLYLDDSPVLAGRPDSVTAQFSKRFASFIEENDLDLSFRNWIQLNPQYTQITQFFKFIFQVLLVMFNILIALGLGELIAMSIMERMREFGALRAIGVTRAQLFGNLLLELGLLVLLGLILGAIIGFALGGIMNNGVEVFYTPPGYSEPVPLFFLLRLNFLILPSIVIALVSFLASLWPISKAVYLKIIEVLRYE